MKKSRSNQNDIIQYDSVPVTNCYGKTHPDGEWGWFVVVAAFVTQFVIVGLQNSSGVIFNELVERYNQPRGETGMTILIEFASTVTVFEGISRYSSCARVQQNNCVQSKTCANKRQ